MRKHEELIGVRLPDGRRYMATVQVGPLESDEDILQRMTKEVGTIFNVLGRKLLVVSLSPYRLKDVTESDEPAKEDVAPKPAKPKREKVEKEPKSERRPAVVLLPQVGETWRPKDPRRIASFIVKEIRGEEILTDDGRSIDISRFSRYVRVSAAPDAKQA